MTIVIDEDAIRALVQTVIAIGGMIVISSGVVVGLAVVWCGAMKLIDWIGDKSRRRRKKK